MDVIILSCKFTSKIINIFLWSELNSCSRKPQHFYSDGYYVQFKLLVAVIGAVWTMLSTWCKSAVGGVLMANCKASTQIFAKKR